MNEEATDYVRLPNDTKIRFCNAMNAILVHGKQCPLCATYVESGDGDLCKQGKDIIARELAYAETYVEFPGATAQNRRLRSEV